LLRFAPSTLREGGRPSRVGVISFVVRILGEEASIVLIGDTEDRQLPFARGLCVILDSGADAINRPVDLRNDDERCAGVANVIAINDVRMDASVVVISGFKGTHGNTHGRIKPCKVGGAYYNAI
jgi:hypothetical protein